MAAENCSYDPQDDGAPSHDPQLCQVAKTLDGAAKSGVVYGYDQYNNVTDTFEFDYGSAPGVGASCPSISGLGGFTRHTNTQFLTGAYVDPNVNLVALPTLTTVSAGGSSISSETQFIYDQGGVAPESTSVVSHDDANYGGTAGLGATRGNLTTVGQCWTQQAPFDPSVACSWRNTNMTYDIAGNVLSVTDPNGHATSYSYADSYSDGNNGRNSYAHPTTTANSLNQRITNQYDYSSGKPTLAIDLNGTRTQYAYADPLDRLTQVVYALGSGAETQRNITYSPNSTEINIYQDQNTSGDKALRTQQLYDGLGRLSESRAYETASSYISTTQTFDTLGRIVRTTDPSRPGDGLNRATTYSYDALGRNKSIVTPDLDAASQSYSADGNGEYVVATDQAGNVRSSAYDGLGRLRQIVEDPSGKNYSTTYSYDPLDNLSSVTQGAQRRSFGYDGTGRLYLALNPESGATTYLYDNAGNLYQKTDARNISSTYSYDALNRPTSIAYSGGTVSTPTVTYTYDAPNIPFSTGNLSSVSSSVSTTNYTAYDPLARVRASNQVINNVTYNFGYSYNLAGSVSQETYPTLATYFTQFDGANRVISTGSFSPFTVNNVTYAPHGAIQSYTFGNGVKRTFAYNARLQPEEITDVDIVHGYGCGGQPTQYLSPPVTKWNLDLQLFWGTGGTQTFGNNGNLYSQMIQTCTGANLATASNFVQNYTYDGVNRMAKVNDSGGGGANSSARTFSYDQFGNMWSKNTAGSFPSNMGTPSAQSNFNHSNNRLTTTTYDAAGNQLGIPAVCTNCLQYDAENRLVSYAPSGTTYTYDGNGQRVQKIANVTEREHPLQLRPDTSFTVWGSRVERLIEL